jgi:hypothetical protein
VYADGTPVEDTMPITSEDSGDKHEIDILLKPGADRLGIRLRDMQGGGALVIGFSTQDSVAEVSCSAVHSTQSLCNTICLPA